MRVLASLAHGHGLSVVVVLHDPTLALRLADRALVLDAGGTPVAHGDAADALTTGSLERAYGIAFERLVSSISGLQAVVPAAKA